MTTSLVPPACLGTRTFSNIPRAKTHHVFLQRVFQYIRVTNYVCHSLLGLPPVKILSGVPQMPTGEEGAPPTGEELHALKKSKNHLPGRLKGRLLHQTNWWEEGSLVWAQCCHHQDRNIYGHKQAQNMQRGSLVRVCHFC